MAARLDRVVQRRERPSGPASDRAGRRDSRPTSCRSRSGSRRRCRPFSSRYFITAGVPPTSCRSSITYWPLGFRSARNGMRSLTAWKSSMRQRHVDRARHGDQMQHRVGRAAQRHRRPPWRSRRPSRVMMSRGLMSRSSRLRIAAPAPTAFVELVRILRPASRSCRAATCPGPRWPRPWCWRCTCRRRRRRPGQACATMSCARCPRRSCRP